MELAVIFLLSGASALLFETLWFRLAGLAFGNSVWASSLVTASFMAGLALGNALAARRGGGVRRPVRAYAGLEAIVGASGLGLVLLFPLLTPLLVPALRPFLARPELLNAVRLGLAFALLVVPATAMGATLPLLVRALRVREPDFGRALGRLYGWNTLGAMLGALAGECLLIEWMGLRATAVAAALLNALAAALAFRISGRWDERPVVAAPEAGQGRHPVRLLAAAFLAGAILLALEVIWFRMILLLINSHASSFAVMLSVVLLGIGAGGLLAALWLRRWPHAERAAPLVALAAGAAAVLGYTSFADAARAQGGGALYGLMEIWRLSLRLMLSTCLLSGVLFTLLGKRLRAGVEGEARAAGLLTLANTTGAALGALAGGFLLLPRLGMEASLFWLALAYAAVAALGAGRDADPPASRRERWGMLATAAALALLLALFPFGLMRNELIKITARAYSLDGSRIETVREGLVETVIYLRRDLWGEPVSYRLVSNSTSMSAAHLPGARYMRFFVYLPVALAPRPRTAVLISYGVGVTAQSLTEIDSLQSLDVVDISPEIVELGCTVFGDGQGCPLRDPRVTLHIEDGRFFLLTTDRRFDLITGEPPPPKNAGVVNLYTREYFQLIHDRLNEGGWTTYWLPVYQLELADTQAVIAGFCSVFEDCSLWSGFGAEWVLAGSRGGRGPGSEEAFTRQWSDPAVAPGLRAQGLEFPEQLGAAFLADAQQLAAYTAGVPPLTDDRPGRLSRLPPVLTPSAYAAYADLARARERFAESGFVRRFWPAALRERTLAAFPQQEPAHRYEWSVHTRKAVGLPEAWQVLTETRQRIPLYWVLGSSARHQQIAQSAARRGVSDPLIDELIGLDALAERDYLRAERQFQLAQRGTSTVVYFGQLRVLALCLAGQKQRAGELLAAAREWARPWSQHSWDWLAGRCGLPIPEPMPVIER